MKARKEVWLYERIDQDGVIGNHLYVVLSDEHPGGIGGVDPATFVEDVYTSGRNWRKLGQGQAFDGLREGKYTYVNYSVRMLAQEWDRPVFACRKSGVPDRPNFLWECFKKQLMQATRRKK